MIPILSKPVIGPLWNVSGNVVERVRCDGRSQDVRNRLAEAGEFRDFGLSGNESCDGDWRRSLGLEGHVCAGCSFQVEFEGWRPNAAEPWHEGAMDVAAWKGVEGVAGVEGTGIGAALIEGCKCSLSAVRISPCWTLVPVAARYRLCISDATKSVSPR